MRININELELPLDNKVIKLKGHLDEDSFRVFTESLETHPNLSQGEKERVREILNHEPNIIID